MRAPGANAGARCWHERALSAPTRVVDTSARYIPLAVSTTPSRCQRPPHGADNARPYRQRALELAPGPGTLRTRPTTRVHTRGSTRTRPRPQEDCSGSRTTPSEYAHKDPDLRNTHRTQGRDQALACGPVLRNSLPCVRHQRTRTPKKDGAKEQTHQPTANQTSKPANPRREGRLTAWGPARTTWEVAPAAPPYGSGFTARCRATMPPVRLRYWTSDQPLRAIMAPRARWSGHWRIDSTK